MTKVIYENSAVKVSALCNSCAKIACCSSELRCAFFYGGIRIKNAVEQLGSFVHISFVNFALHPTPQTET